MGYGLCCYAIAMLCYGPEDRGLVSCHDDIVRNSVCHSGRASAGFPRLLHVHVHVLVSWRFRLLYGVTHDDIDGCSQASAGAAESAVETK